MGLPGEVTKTKVLHLHTSNALLFLPDPEWVNLDGFAVMGGAAVSNSSAGNPDLEASATATGNDGSNLKRLHMLLPLASKGTQGDLRPPVLSSLLGSGFPCVWLNTFLLHYI